jgi:hypothetical protein
MNAEYLRDLFYRIASPQHSEQRVETSRFCGLAVLHGRLGHSASLDHPRRSCTRPIAAVWPI